MKIKNLLFLFAFLLTGFLNKSFAQCAIDSVAIDTLSPMIICDGSSYTFQFTSYGTCSGQYEYQVSAEGSVVQNWGTTSTFTANPTDSTNYVVEARCSACPTITVTDTFAVVVVKQPNVGNVADICGGDSINIVATPNGNESLTWWDGNDPTTSNQISPNGTLVTDTLTDTTTLYVGATSTVQTSGGATGKVLITEVGLEGSSNGTGSNDYIEITNLYNVPINTTGWTVALSNSYTNINSVNISVWNLGATMQPCTILARRDVIGTPDYWGSNILWDPNQPGWAVILDENNNIVDMAIWGWTPAQMANFSPTINGQTVTIGTEWNGATIDDNCGTVGGVMHCFSRTGASDNNDAGDFICIPTSLEVINPGLNCGWSASKTCYTPVTINVTPTPAIDSLQDMDVCGPYTLPVITGDNLTGHEAYYTGEFGTGTQYNAGDVISDTTTLYMYDSTYNSMQCADQSPDFTVTIYPDTINLDAGPDLTICEGDTIVLLATGAPNYTWNHGVTNSDSVVPALGNTTYIVNSSYGVCDYSDTVNVTVNVNPPSANFAALITETCVGTPVPFVNYTAEDTTQTLTANWEYGDGDTGTDYDTTYHAYSQEGTYDITLTITNEFGCTSTKEATQYIHIVDGPVAAFTADPMVTDLNNTQVNFTNNSTGATHYAWNFGDQSAGSTDENPTHSFPGDAPNVYTVTLYAMNDKSCVDSVSHPIKLIYPDPVYTIPNVFTPDGDGVNDFFKFVNYANISSLHIEILNRWGNLVFTSDKVDFKWDGMNKDSNTKCDDGAYFYKITIKDFSKKEHEAFGYVHLIHGKK